MKVKFKKLNEKAVMPIKAHKADAGADLTATSVCIDEQGNYVYGTGIAVEIPCGYVGLVFPRSSIARSNLALSNAVGVIDSNYRGEIMAKFKVVNQEIQLSKLHKYKVGERIAQLIILPYPEIEYIESEELSDSDRGNGGYGSTGK